MASHKSKLEKLVKADSYDLEYETTIDDCIEWFEVLNKVVFKNALTPVDEIDIRWRRGAYAYYECLTDTKNPTYSYTKLCLNKRYKSKQFFVTVLGHELVHHYQFLTKGKISHGESFYEWVDTFNKKGLRLVKAY